MSRTSYSSGGGRATCSCGEATRSGISTSAVTAGNRARTTTVARTGVAHLLVPLRSRGVHDIDPHGQGALSGGPRWDVQPAAFDWAWGRERRCLEHAAHRLPPWVEPAVLQVNDRLTDEVVRGEVVAVPRLNRQLGRTCECGNTQLAPDRESLTRSQRAHGGREGATHPAAPLPSRSSGRTRGRWYAPARACGRTASSCRA